MWFSLYKHLYSVPDELKNTNILPLIHTHKGQPCPVSTRNQKKIETHRQQVSQIEQNELSKIKEAQGNVDTALNRFHLAKTQYNQISPDAVPSDPQQFDILQKINHCDQTIARLTKELNGLSQPPADEDRSRDIKHTIIALQNQQRELHDHHTSSPQTMEKQDQINQIKHQSKIDLENIAGQIEQLKQDLTKVSHKPKPDKNNLDQTMTTLRHMREQIESDLKTNSNIISKKLNQVKTETEIKHRSSAEVNDNIVKEINQLESQLTQMNNMLNDLQKKYDDLPKRHLDFSESDNKGLTKWQQNRQAAENEIQNIQTKTNLFKKASSKELNDLDSQNDEIIASLRKELDVTKTNESLALKELKNRISHDRKHAVVEVTYGTQQSLPITSFVIEPRPQVVVRAVKNLVPELVPQTTMINKHDFIYYNHGNIQETKPYKSNTTYHEYPDVISREIIHDTTTPKITVELQKRREETKKETVIRTPITKKVVETVFQEQQEVKPVKVTVTYQDLLANNNVRDVTQTQTISHSQPGSSHSASYLPTHSSSSSSSSLTTGSNSKSRSNTNTIKSEPASISQHESSTETHYSRPAQPYENQSWYESINPLKWFS